MELECMNLAIQRGSGRSTKAVKREIKRVGKPEKIRRSGLRK
jgi:hypothetical protein